MNPANRRLAHFPFLNLPRELRDLVYVELLKGITASPPAFPDFLQHYREERRDGNFSHIMYLPFPAHAFVETSFLRLVNRQVRAEVLEVLSRKLDSPSCQPLMYTLDCIQLQNCVVFYETCFSVPVVSFSVAVFPTWLSVPVLSRNVEVLTVNFRLFGNARSHYRDWSEWIAGSGRDLFSNLIELLARFMSRDADFLYPHKSTFTRIGQLVLNVISPDDWSPFVPVLRETTPPSKEIVLEFARIRQMLWENVGEITFCVDGHECKETSLQLFLLLRENYNYCGCRIGVLAVG